MFQLGNYRCTLIILPPCSRKQNLATPVRDQVIDKNLDRSYGNRYPTYGSIDHELYSRMIASELEEYRWTDPFHKCYC